MITLTKGQLRFLLAGRPINIDTQHQYRRGHIYAVAREGHRKSTCRALIIETHQTQPDSWRLTIALYTQQDPVYLAATSSHGDYTTNPATAARETNGSPIERVDPTEIERVNRRRRERVEALKTHVLEQVDELAAAADRVEAQRLRNLRRVASSL